MFSLSKLVFFGKYKNKTVEKDEYKNKTVENDELLADSREAVRMCLVVICRYQEVNGSFINISGIGGEKTVTKISGLFSTEHHRQQYHRNLTS